MKTIMHNYKGLSRVGRGGELWKISWSRVQGPGSSPFEAVNREEQQSSSLQLALFQLARNKSWVVKKT